jgi:16S rRNA (cytosine967-C5)-methyltransferase
MKKNERLQALTILTTLLQDRVPLSHLMPTSAQLTPLTKELCFGVCRHYFQLEALADFMLTKRPKVIEVWVALLMGLYQLHYLRIPDYAVVKETVELLDNLKKTWAKGLVNALLRRYCREQDKLLAACKKTFNHPRWFVHRMQTAWPNDWQKILEANDTHPPMTLRVHAPKTTTQAYLSQLHAAGKDAHPLRFSPVGIALTQPCDVHELPGFSAGEVSLQDQAAQLAVSLLALEPGLRVLDACAAPGGKTCHILETEQNLFACIALDIDSKRLLRVEENLNRLQLKATLLKGDASTPESWWDGQLFDRILLDAPCSATGVIRRHPDIKLLRTEAEITVITNTQRQILQALWPLLAPNGILVYATCSVLPEENEVQINQFIANQSDCSFVSHDNPWGHDTGHGWQILPGENNMDGFFYSVLKKNSPNLGINPL